MAGRSFRRFGVAFAAVSLVAGMLAFAGPAQAVQLTVLEFEGYYTTGGNLSTAEILTGDWTKTLAGCCTLGVVNDSLNIVDANTLLLGNIQLIGDTGNQGGPDGGSVVSPGPPDFAGTVLTAEGVAEGLLITADFTGATNLGINWQLVKIVIKQGNANEGIFVATSLFSATDPIQQALIPSAEFEAYINEAPGNNPGIGQSHFTAFGVAGTETVPEPGTLMLLGLGLVGLGVIGRRSKIER